MLDGLNKRLKFSSNNPSNCVQHDKKVLDINVGRVKSALRNYLKKKQKLPKGISQISQVYFGQYALLFIIGKDPMINSRKHECK